MRESVISRYFFLIAALCRNISIDEALISRYNFVYLHKIESAMVGTELFYGCTTAILEEVLPNGRVIVITDENVNRLYPDLVHRYEYVVIGSGEHIKNLDTVAHIYDQLMAMGADRSTFLLGIGGGIVTDITGFVASTYMRGVKFGFVSTTLLGQVDASVGGKNGVNVADYKNMVGTITQPQFVVSDVTLLATLPERELRAGFAEVVKSAIVGDGELFDYIECNATSDLFSSQEHMQHIVRRAMSVKMAIVEEDEFEGGKRRLLNLGHTLGHAIEKLTHEVNHGEAVAMGMSLIAHAAMRLGLFSRDDAERLDNLLIRLGFNLVPPVPIDRILFAAQQDKKRCDDSIHVVFPLVIGRCEVRKMMFNDFVKLFV